MNPVSGAISYPNTGSPQVAANCLAAKPNMHYVANRKLADGQIAAGFQLEAGVEAGDLGLRLTSFSLSDAASRNFLLRTEAREAQALAS